MPAQAGIQLFAGQPNGIPGAKPKGYDKKLAICKKKE
jgi:hypothetical protein